MTNNTRPKLILLGGGGHCAACIDVIESGNEFEPAGVIDRDSTVGSVCGYPLLGDDSQLTALRAHYDYALITVGQIRDASTRLRLFKLVTSLGFKLPTIVSPRAYVSKHATLGIGTIIMHDALVNARARIGNNCIINSKALIEHDAVIEDHCHISTGAIINGGAVIKVESFVGSNAVTAENVMGRKGAFIKAGTIFKGCQDE